MEHTPEGNARELEQTERGSKRSPSGLENLASPGATTVRSCRLAITFKMASDHEALCLTTQNRDVKVLQLREPKKSRSASPWEGYPR